MRTPLDEVLARLPPTDGRLELEVSFADLVMGSNPTRWETLATIAALPEAAFTHIQEVVMAFSFSKFSTALMTLAPMVVMLIPGGDKVAPYLPTILQGIAEAEQLQGASGPDKKAHVTALVGKAADALATAAPGKTNKDDLIKLAGTTIDTVISTIHVIEQAHASATGATDQPPQSR